MSMTREAGHVYALLADGTTVEIRPATPDDVDAVQAMHEAMSRDHAYMRFFNFSPQAGGIEAHRICRDPSPDQVALLALSGGEVVGCASYTVPRQPGESERTAGSRPSTAPSTAEVAFAVADHMHHRGIATLLLEHLVSRARSQQITTFTAQTLTGNRAMLNVFADVGLPVDRHDEAGVYEMTFPLTGDALPAGDGGTALDGYLEAVAERERRADIASLRHVLAPESVAVIGAGRSKGTAGRAILDNIRAGGYAGRLYAVNPRARQIGGERCLASVLDLPEPADLAVIAVPAGSVLEVAEQCGQRGVRSLVVITSGLDAGGCADLLAVCRRHGMRLVGPDGFGVAVPAIGLNATFTVRPPRPGVAGLVMQSGGLGFALVDQLSRLGIGISSFASVGPKLDVSSNDMLLWWEHDGVTKVAVLYIESFGNPRKFARTARRVGAVMPVLTVLAGRSAAGQQAPALAGAEAGSVPPLASREALFEQAGIITTRGFGELIEATALLATQPVPAGRTVAIVSNVGSAGRLAADACADLGLTVHHPHGLTKRRLHALVPATGTVAGPVDLTATASGEHFRQGLELLAADEQVHAIIALILPTGATGDLVQAVQEADVGIPLAAVVLDQAESVRLLPRPGGGRMPAYGYPEAAVAAVARAAGYGAWRAEPRGRVPGFPGVKITEARALVREFLKHAPAGGWLPPEQAADLLRGYGISPAADQNTPVTLGTGAGTGTGADVAEVTVRVTADDIFGPLVALGLPGATGGVFADRAARLTPLTDTGADRLIRSVRSAGLLPGHEAAAAALRDLVLRVSRLADDLPQVTDLRLDPVLVGPAGILVADARIMVTPSEHKDPFLRRLR
jgi:acyl-CoA synthetase (NDP forming)/GNAT superfamily N-acetyltransferase